MRLALLSDVHANRHALQACLAHARRAGVARFAFLGDLVGYGAEPGAVVDEVMALCAAGAVAIRGNHEAAALAPAGAAPKNLEELSAQWTGTQLNEGQRAFLGALPLTASLESTLLVHASADAPDRWTYVERPEQAQLCLDAAAALGTQRVFCGHVHEQCLYFASRTGKLLPFTPVDGVPVPLAAHRGWVALVGSVGQPRDGDPRAMYAVLDVAQQRLAFHRVAYDHLGAAAAIRRSGLPESFAQRLENGR
ncbi:MAG: metallophosphoesterase family protein [Burkholderiales bacterium]|nr:metallophosphoesterase family protein [Burkholderiales bacterium]